MCPDESEHWIFEFFIQKFVGNFVGKNPAALGESVARQLAQSDKAIMWIERLTRRDGDLPAHQVRFSFDCAVVQRVLTLQQEDLGLLPAVANRGRSKPEPSLNRSFNR